MAKCSIVFEDGDEPNEVKLTIDFDPPVSKGKPTPAQAEGYSLYECLVKGNNGTLETDTEGEKHNV